MDEQKVKRNTVVCDKCRARKQRCNGESPCAFCKRNQLSCSYIHVPKKRGPKRKQSEESQNNNNNKNINNENININNQMGVSAIIDEGVCY